MYYLNTYLTHVCRDTTYMLGCVCLPLQKGAYTIMFRSIYFIPYPNKIENNTFVIQKRNM